MTRAADLKRGKRRVRAIRSTKEYCPHCSGECPYAHLSDRKAALVGRLTIVADQLDLLDYEDLSSLAYTAAIKNAVSVLAGALEETILLAQEAP